MRDTALLRAIRILGTQTLLAQALGTTPQRVNNWLNRQDDIPYDQAIIIEALTKGRVLVEELVPHKSKANKIIREWRNLQKNNCTTN